MNKEQYPYFINTNRISFEFLSEGPKGKIEKAVRFTPREAGGHIYNLGFGDLNEVTNEIDDFIVSNNGDKEKVLATVAATVLEFTKQFPHAFVYAKGSTPGRTRLYQMAILQNLHLIEMQLYLYGLAENTWSSFQAEVNYEAFMVLHK